MPCWVGERGMPGVISLWISISRILRELQNKDIGLLEDGSVGEMNGFRKGNILPSFHMLGMVFGGIGFV